MTKPPRCLFARWTNCPAAVCACFSSIPTQSADALESSFVAHDFVRALSLPGTRIETKWRSFEAYKGAMRKFYRRAICHDQKAAAGLSIQIERDFGHLAPEVHRLYLNVVEKAVSTFEQLTEDFFRELGSIARTRAWSPRAKNQPANWSASSF